jgi:sulfatase maturation enzyme AslB (radical SAM superfamily)
VIFTRGAFHSSFKQSPGYDHFELSQQQDGVTDTLPIDLHVDLGNYCNLACKMCWSGASTRIASQYVRWGHEDHGQYLGNDWTKDSIVWHRVLNELLTTPKLKNIHFMGGETLLTSRFEEFVDFMIQHERFDLCFSFVTNGTVFKEPLINKLKKFSRVGIEISIESTTEHNDYVRQGTNTKAVLDNIKKYQQHCDESSVTITLRPAISALTVGYYYTLLEYCLEQKFLIKSLLVTTPNYLNINVLPKEIKNQYKENYQKILDKIPGSDTDQDYNESDMNNYLQSIKLQAQQMLTALDQSSTESLLGELVAMCRRWDNEFGFNAVNLYPELAGVFKQHGY